ncbi:MAG: hypothetical protein ACI8UO_003408 [Verrucomicrobiales bacterium]|jgi:hypothetical protein
MNCSDLSVYLSGLTHLASKSLFGKSNFADEANRLCDSFAPFGDIPLKEITTWIGKSFLTPQALINAVSDGAKRRELPAGFGETLEKAGTPALKAVAKHFGMSLGSKATKAEVANKIREFLSERGATAEPKIDHSNKLSLSGSRVAEMEKSALAALELLELCAGDSMGKAPKQALADVIELVIRLGGIEPFSTYVQSLAKASPSSALGLHFAAKAASIEPGVLRDLSDELSAAELKKLCGWLGLPKTGARAALVERVAETLELPELSPEELMRLATYEYHQLRDEIGFKLDVAVAQQLLAERVGAFGAATLKKVAEAEGFSTRLSKPKFLVALANHLGQLATTRTRG